MAKKNSEKADRRAIVEQLRKEQQRKERRRTIAIISACVAAGLVIIGLGAYPLIRDARDSAEFSDVELAEIGVTANEAGCQNVETRAAEGNNDHQPDGIDLDYADAPPAFGPHYGAPASMEQKFYTAQDRPAVETLVHNLEHGYTILWYDESAADDSEQVSQLRAIADKFSGTEDLENKFIVAPWTSEDGEPFPEDTTIALTHWSVGAGEGEPSMENQQGVWQYCESASGEVVADFVEEWPFSDSPEPNAF